jgi:hypothetical protein
MRPQCKRRAGLPPKAPRALPLLNNTRTQEEVKFLFTLNPKLNLEVCLGRKQQVVPCAQSPGSRTCLFLHCCQQVCMRAGAWQQGLTPPLPRRHPTASPGPSTPEPGAWV